MQYTRGAGNYNLSSPVLVIQFVDSGHNYAELPKDGHITIMFNISKVIECKR